MLPPIRFCVPATLLALTLLGCRSTPAPAALVVHTLDGEPVSPLGTTEARATLLLFVGVDCPTSNLYAPEIARIYAEYGPQGVDFYLVYWDADVPVEGIHEQLREYSLDLPVLLDFDYVLVDYTGATRIPEAALLSPAGELLYRGRIDDRYVDFGKKRLQANERDLRDALDAVLRGKRPAVARTEAVGCFISRPTR